LLLHSQQLAKTFVLLASNPTSIRGVLAPHIIKKPPQLHQNLEHLRKRKQTCPHKIRQFPPSLLENDLEHKRFGIFDKIPELLLHSQQLAKFLITLASNAKIVVAASESLTLVD
jgi:hypothetical protein